MAPKLSRDKLDLIDDLLYKSKRPKQALKELEKWLKKVPGSAQLQVSHFMHKPRFSRTAEPMRYRYLKHNRYLSVIATTRAGPSVRR